MEKKIPDCIRSWTLGEGISMRVRHKFVRLISLIGCRIILVTEGGGGVLPCINYIGMCMPPHWVASLGPFGLKTGTHFAHFSLESGMVFEGTTGVYERIYLKKKKEKYANSKWI